MIFKTAIIFPGQGSQNTGMLSAFEGNSIIRETFHEASNKLGMDLWEIIQKNPDNKLNQTEITQPALLTASVALWRFWQEKNSHLPIVAMAGHSLGEYSALVCSESLSFQDAVYLVFQRGRFMQDAVSEGQGAMAAIVGLTIETVMDICMTVANDQVISSANINAPGQVVIAGESAAVLRGIEAAQKAGAKLVKQLAVSVPSHCLLMKPAAEKMKALLDSCEMNLPKIPVVQNVEALQYHDIQSIKDALVRQLFSAVQWVDSIENIINYYYAEQFVECGPGKVLSGLNKRILNKMNKDEVSTLMVEV